MKGWKYERDVIEIIHSFYLIVLAFLINDKTGTELVCRNAHVVRSLDPCSKGLGSNQPSDLSHSVRIICQLSVRPGKKAKGNSRCGHIEREDQGALLDKCTYSMDPMCFEHFEHKPEPYGDNKRICLSTINALLLLVYLFSVLCVL